MKITCVELYHLKVPMKKTFRMSQAVGAIQVTEPIVVKVFADGGLCGYGETGVIPGFSDETPGTILQVLKNNIGPAIIGMDPLNLARLHTAMDKAVKSNYAAKATVDLACHDILGKHLGVPVYKLFGGALHEEIPMMRSLGNDPSEVAVAETLGYRTEGYNTVMIKVGARTLEQDAETVVRIREAVGKDFHLVVDVNQGWDFDKTTKFCKLIKACDIDLLEQPVPSWDVDSLARIRRKFDIPVSADEGIVTIHDARQLIQKEAVDVFSIKVAKHGGLYRAREIVTLANAYGIKCLMNSMLEEGITQAASLQLGCTLPNLADMGHAYFSPLRLEDDITTYSSQLANGIARINDKPGLGIELRPEVFEKFVFSSQGIS